MPTATSPINVSTNGVVIAPVPAAQESLLPSPDVAEATSPSADMAETSAASPPRAPSPVPQQLVDQSHTAAHISLAALRIDSPVPQMLILAEDAVAADIASETLQERSASPLAADGECRPHIITAHAGTWKFRVDP
jgi:uncharacterized GH25 family protein